MGYDNVHPRSFSLFMEKLFMGYIFFNVLKFLVLYILVIETSFTYFLKVIMTWFYILRFILICILLYMWDVR